MPWYFYDSQKLASLATRQQWQLTLVQVIIISMRSEKPLSDPPWRYFRSRFPNVAFELQIQSRCDWRWSLIHYDQIIYGAPSRRSPEGLQRPKDAHASTHNYYKYITSDGLVGEKEKKEMTNQYAVFGGGERSFWFKRRQWTRMPERKIIPDDRSEVLKGSHPTSFPPTGSSCPSLLWRRKIRVGSVVLQEDLRALPFLHV